jgi:hypothetical protein
MHSEDKQTHFHTSLQGHVPSLLLVLFLHGRVFYHVSAATNEIQAHSLSFFYKHHQIPLADCLVQWIWHWQMMAVLSGVAEADPSIDAIVSDVTTNQLN